MKFRALALIIPLVIGLLAAPLAADAPPASKVYRGPAAGLERIWV